MSDPVGASDAAILRTLGERLERARLERNRTQRELAREAGISKRTVERIEAGESTQLSNLVRLLRALGLLDRMDLLVPLSPPSPIERLKQRERERRRASPARPTDAGEGHDARGPAPRSGWQWGDERPTGGDT